MVTRNPANHPVCRIGFVGTGGVATRHARVLSGFEDVTLVGVTDVDRAGGGLRHAVRHRGGRRRGGPARRRPGRRVRLRAAVRARPRRGGEVQVADAGVPMFVEKPVAVDLETAERIAAAWPSGRAHRASATTGATWTRWSRPGSCSPTARSGWSTAPGWTRCRRWRGGAPGPLRRPGGRAGRPRARPGAGCWSARSRWCRPARAAPSPAVTSTPPWSRSCRSSTARSARSPPPACSAGSTGPAWRSSPTGSWSLAEDGLEVTTAAVTSPRATGGRRASPSTGPSSTRCGPLGDTSAARTRRPCAPTGWRWPSRARPPRGAGAAPVNRPAPPPRPAGADHTPPGTDLALVVEEPGRAAVRPVPATDGPCRSAPATAGSPPAPS